MSGQESAIVRLRYEEIAAGLRQKIEAGELQPGDRLPSLGELRRQHGITQSTVERAYTVLEKDGLIVRSHRSGVFVADPRRRPRTGLIGVCGFAFSKTHFSPYWTPLIEGIEVAAGAAQSQIVLLRGDSPHGWDKIDGLLSNPGEDSAPARHLPPRLPVVGFFAPATFEGTAEECARAAGTSSFIRMDDYAGIRQATQHLIDLGHRRIGYLNNSPHAPELYAARLAGYNDALRAAAITPDDRWLRVLATPSPFLYFMNAGRDAMRLWLRDGFREVGITALLAHNDDTAWGAVEALREASIAVPEDVSVVGFDGTQSAECCTPPLTTIEVPLRNMGQTAVEMLWRRLAGETVSAEVVLPIALRVRASTGAPR